MVVCISYVTRSLFSRLRFTHPDNRVTAEFHCNVVFAFAFSLTYTIYIQHISVIMKLSVVQTLEQEGAIYIAGGPH